MGGVNWGKLFKVVRIFCVRVWAYEPVSVSSDIAVYLFENNTLNYHMLVYFVNSTVLLIC